MYCVNVAETDISETPDIILKNSSIINYEEKGRWKLLFDFSVCWRLWQHNIYSRGRGV